MSGFELTGRRHSVYHSRLHRCQFSDEPSHQVALFLQQIGRRCLNGPVYDVIRKLINQN